MSVIAMTKCSEDLYSCHNCGILLTHCIRTNIKKSDGCGKKLLEVYKEMKPDAKEADVKKQINSMRSNNLSSSHQRRKTVGPIAKQNQLLKLVCDYLSAESTNTTTL